MLRSLLLLLVPALLVGCSRPSPEPVADSDLPVVTVYKTPTCGCCVLWADHMEANGFTVEQVDVRDLNAIRAEHGVPPQIGSCHTAVVDGYVVEGHVPADDVKRLLSTRPDEAIGISVPGMPIGSPGMENPNHPGQPYEVLLFTDDGRMAVFSRHTPS